MPKGASRSRPAVTAVPRGVSRRISECTARPRYTPCTAKYPRNYETYAVARTLLYPLNMKNLIKTALLVILGSSLMACAAADVQVPLEPATRSA